MLFWAAQVSTLKQASVTVFGNSLNLLCQFVVVCSCRIPKPFLTRINGSGVDAHLWHGHVVARVRGSGSASSMFRSSAACLDLSLQSQSKLLPAKDFGVLAASMLHHSS